MSVQLRPDPLLAAAAELLRNGRAGEAIGPLSEAARLDPGNAVIQHDLGLALLETGRVADAISAFQAAVGNEPEYADAYFRLGIALERNGQTRDAVAAYDRATGIDPSLSEAWFRAGSLVLTLGYREEAIACFRRASATGGNSGFGRLGKARALLAEERNEEAEKVLRKAVAQDAGNALAYDLLGNLLTELGRFEEAREVLRRAIELSPALAGNYYELVRCRPLCGPDAGLLDEMRAALAAPELDEAQRLRVHLAIGKAADDLGDYKTAMREFDAADEIRRKCSGFDPAAFAKQVERVISRCDADVMRRAGEIGISEATPVLIVGMPRSGTTLVEQIISMHPEVRAAGELNFWNERGAEWHGVAGAEHKREFLQKAGADYLSLLRKIGQKAARVTDKMPFNFLWAGLIHLALPHATIIHCRRAPVDTAISIHQTFFHPSLAFPTGGQALVEYFRVYQRLMEHWRRVLPPNRFLEVDYEELTGDPEPVIRRMIEACGLRWHDACLRPDSNKRAVKTPSKWQARQPIYRSSVARWRRYEPWLGSLRELVDQPGN